jgi:hypothetical protein
MPLPELKIADCALPITDYKDNQSEIKNIHDHD